MIKPALTLLVWGALCFSAQAQDDNTSRIAERFRAMYPKTSFRDIRASQVAGIYEVVMGDNTAYTDATARYFIFGHLFDMQEQVDLTAQRQVDNKKSEFPTQFLANAIKTVRGDGSRVLAIFSDPDCPYCKTVEAQLAKLDNITVYTFLYPLEAIHPQAKTRSVSIWCAPNKTKAWADLMLTGNKPKLVACNNPINDNLVLGSRLGVVGTPTLIALDGRLMPGSAPAERIEAWLSAAVLSSPNGVVKP